VNQFGLRVVSATILGLLCLPSPRLDIASVLFSVHQAFGLGRVDGAGTLFSSGLFGPASASLVVSACAWLAACACAPPRRVHTGVMVWFVSRPLAIWSVSMA
jgi:hypothetical protein